MKVAFSHDWLNGMRGGEKCLEALCELYPGSPIYTLFHEKGKISGRLAGHPIRPSFAQKFPKVYSHYRYYLPFFPAAIESFDLEGYDLVVSTSHCVAKGIRPAPSARHVCYCFTPMRYAWGFFEDYFGKNGGLSQKTIRFFMRRLRDWDLRTSRRVDHFIAISEHVKKRIKDFYGREADVVYPPVDTDFYSPDPGVRREDFYLMVSALVPYKRLELAVKAFNRLKKKLLVIGDGPGRRALSALAGPNVRFLGWRPDEEVRDVYRRARALVFPGEEDFGIVPVEMQGCGGFVIAYGRGGTLETVERDLSGVFFEEPSEEALMAAVQAFEKKDLSPHEARANALRFNRPRFQAEMKQKIEQFMAGS